MIAWASTLKEMRERIDAMIQVMGEDAPVATIRSFEAAFEIVGDTPNEDGTARVIPCPSGDYFEECGVQIEYVFINKETGQVVGDEANDYKPKQHERAAVKIS